MAKPTDQRLATVPFGATPAGPPPSVKEWANRVVWNERMLDALLKGVRTSPPKGFTACTKLTGGCTSPSRDNHQLESRMREIRPSGSEGGGVTSILPTPI